MKGYRTIIVSALLTIMLAACTSDAIYDLAVDKSLTVEDAQSASKVFKAAGNSAGVQCMDFLAVQMGTIRTLHTDLPAPANRGPLTKFAIAHSGIDAIKTIRSKGTNKFNTNCGALYSQTSNNLIGFIAKIKRIAIGL